MYWREPVDGQSCTMDSTAHYYRFNGRYSHMLEKIFILLMNLSMVYTLTLALYNIYVASRRYKPTRTYAHTHTTHTHTRTHTHTHTHTHTRTH